MVYASSIEDFDSLEMYKWSRGIGGHRGYQKFLKFRKISKMAKAPKVPKALKVPKVSVVPEGAVVPNVAVVPIARYVPEIPRSTNNTEDADDTKGINGSTSSIKLA